MNSITKIDTGTLSKALNKQMTLGEARGLLTEAGIINDIDLTKFTAETQGGTYLGGTSRCCLRSEAEPLRIHR